uniref:ORF102 n=1 Tax=Malaco herpesvirus 1 TaxID=3031797 RepID=A0AA48P7U6_9VIRU|nr:TPA_asm: ORF102 [Malaco herpesvirus 1]
MAFSLDDILDLEFEELDYDEEIDEEPTPAPITAVTCDEEAVSADEEDTATTAKSGDDDSDDVDDEDIYKNLDLSDVDESGASPEDGELMDVAVREVEEDPENPEPKRDNESHLTKLIKFGRDEKNKWMLGDLKLPETFTPAVYTGVPLPVFEGSKRIAKDNHIIFWQTMYAQAYGSPTYNDMRDYFTDDLNKRVLPHLTNKLIVCRDNVEYDTACLITLVYLSVMSDEMINGKRANDEYSRSAAGLTKYHFVELKRARDYEQAASYARQHWRTGGGFMRNRARRGRKMPNRDNNQGYERRWQSRDYVHQRSGGYRQGSGYVAKRSYERRDYGRRY